MYSYISWSTTTKGCLPVSRTQKSPNLKIQCHQQRRELIGYCIWPNSKQLYDKQVSKNTHLLLLERPPKTNIWQSIAAATWNALGQGPTCPSDPLPVHSGWNHNLFSTPKQPHHHQHQENTIQRHSQLERPTGTKSSSPQFESKGARGDEGFTDVVNICVAEELLVDETAEEDHLWLADVDRSVPAAKTE